MDVKIDYSKMFGHESALSEFKNATNGLVLSQSWGWNPCLKLAA